MGTIAVAVSGGVDSLYALLSLKEKGEHDIVAVHGLFLPHAQGIVPENKPLLQLQSLCENLQIPLHVLNLRKQFDALVIEPFVRAYAQGLTPNPCALCNAGIKFGLLMDAAIHLGAQSLATGHYARLTHVTEAQSTQNPNPYSSVLSKASDGQKDQSYFLCLVPQERLKNALFPLAYTQKKDNVAHVQRRGIAVPVAKESQEICFVPADAYRPFLQKQAQAKQIELGTEGPMLWQDDAGVELEVGRHAGLWQYTEGQRRGLGIAWKEPLYVCAKDGLRNALMVGEKHKALLHGCVARRINWLIPSCELPSSCFVRVRYRQKETLAKVSLEAQGGQGQETCLRIEFAAPQSPTAPGQIAAIYDEYGNILAGAIIEEVF